MLLSDFLDPDQRRSAREYKQERKSKANRSKLKCKCEDGSGCEYYESGKCIAMFWYDKSLSSLKQELTDYGRGLKFRKGDGYLEALDDCPNYVERYSSAW